MTALERLAICQRIKQAREEAGLTQEEMADILNVGQRTVSNYESIRVPWRHMEGIAEATGRTKSWLFYGDEPLNEAAVFAELTEIRELLVEVLRRLTP